MSADTPRAFRATHSVASAIHSALAGSGMTTAQLASAIVESERFINGVLQGEDGLDRLINIAFLQKIADATKRTLVIRIPPQRPGNRPSHRKITAGSQP